MYNDELESKKKELMELDWTEDLHHELEEMSKGDAKKIVDSMSESEIYIKVNNRRFQEDYIADYLEFLWTLSKDAYWKHVITTLDPVVGILWSDNMSHFEKLCKNKIPNDVLIAVMNFAINCDEANKQDMDAIGCVIKFQVKNHNRINEINEYISSINNVGDVGKLHTKVHEMINCDCNYFL